MRFTGWLDDDVLDGLYRAATCLVFPSLAEGFGLPVLDALVRGTPVATSNATSLPEVAGDAALYFDPEDTDAIAAAIERLLEDEGLRDRLRKAGPVAGGEVQLGANRRWDARELPASARLTTIGIDARAAAEVPAGRGRFVRELLLGFGVARGRRTTSSSTVGGVGQPTSTSGFAG